MKIYDEWLQLTLNQFYDKPILNGIIRALAETFQDIYDESQELRSLLDIDKQAGVNLDNIGDIVCLSRSDAHAIMRLKEGFELTDEMYRKVLKYQIVVNNSNASYYDIMEGIGLIWNQGDVIYREDKDKPATYILDLQSFDIDDNDIVSARTMTIRAGGVRVLFRCTWLLRISYDFWKTVALNVHYEVSVKFFDDAIRKFDGSWKLDGTVRLDASADKILHVTYRCGSTVFPGQIVVIGACEIPDRLIIMGTENTYVSHKESTVNSMRGNAILASTDEGGMLVTTQGNPTVMDNVDGLRVDGSFERSVIAEDYLVSSKEMYGVFQDDGLRIAYTDYDLLFDLEIAPIMTI